MATNTDTILVRKNIRLVKDVHLIFDKERDFYRVALWRPRRPNEDHPMVESHLYEAMTRAAMIPKKPRDYWTRFTATGKELKDPILMVIHMAKVTINTDELFHYIRSTEWREHLPL